MPLHIDHLPFTIVRPPMIPEEDFGGDGRLFYISKKVLASIQECGTQWKLFNAELIEEVLLSPCAVLGGLNRKEFDSGLCYVSHLQHRYNRHGELEEMPDERLFLVFVKKFMGLVVFDWEFRQRSQGNKNLPVGCGDDFGGIKWELTL